jgi:hypothetical protein
LIEAPVIVITRKSEDYSEKEAKARFEAALKSAMKHVAQTAKGKAEGGEENKTRKKPGK